MTNPLPDDEIISNLEDIKTELYLFKRRLEQGIGSLEYTIEKINKLQEKLSNVTG